MKTVWALLAASTVSLACGANEMSGSIPSGGGSPQQCPIVLSGAVTATFGCDGLGSAAGTYDPSSNVSSVGISRTAGPSEVSGVDVDISFGGAMRTGTFTMADTPSTALSQVTFDGNRSYGAFSATNSIPAQGAYTLNVTHVSTAGMNGSVSLYMVHGTLDATLAPIGNGASGTVTLHATF